MPGPRMPAHGVGEVVPGDRTGQRSAFPMVLGCATARVKFLSRPWAWASVPCTIRYDSSRGSSTPPAILPWDSGRSARPLGPGRLRATVRPRQLWRAPEYATATVGRIRDGRVSVALRRRRHNLLNGVTVGTRIDPDLPPGFRLHACKSHGFIVHWALWRLLRSCHVRPPLPASPANVIRVPSREEGESTLLSWFASGAASTERGCRGRCRCVTSFPGCGDLDRFRHLPRLTAVAAQPALVTGMCAAVEAAEMPVDSHRARGIPFRGQLFAAHTASTVSCQLVCVVVWCPQIRTRVSRDMAAAVYLWRLIGGIGCPRSRQSGVGHVGVCAMAVFSYRTSLFCRGTPRLSEHPPPVSEQQDPQRHYVECNRQGFRHDGFVRNPVRERAAREQWNEHKGSGRPRPPPQAPQNSA